MTNHELMVAGISAELDKVNKTATCYDHNKTTDIVKKNNDRYQPVYSKYTGHIICFQ